MTNKKLFFTFITPTLIVVVICTALMMNYNPNDIKSKYQASINKLVVSNSPEYPTDLSTKGQKLLNNELIKPLREKLNIKVTGNSFSRCPSGLTNYLSAYPSEADLYFNGTVSNFKGCMEERICDFRISLKEDKIEIMDEKNNLYVSAEEWMNDNKDIITEASAE